jgi:hypothetical protein
MIQFRFVADVSSSPCSWRVLAVCAGMYAQEQSAIYLLALDQKGAPLLDLKTVGRHDSERTSARATSSACSASAGRSK